METLDAKQVGERIGRNQRQVLRDARNGKIPAPLPGPTQRPKWRAEDIDAFTSALATIHSAVIELRNRAGDFTLNYEGRFLARDTAKLLVMPELSLAVRVGIAARICGGEFNWASAGINDVSAANLERIRQVRREILAIIGEVESYRETVRRGGEERN